MSIGAAMAGGASAVYERHERDLYPTPSELTIGLLEAWDAPGRVWECAAGDGAMARDIRSTGRQVVTSDIEHGADFLTCLPPGPFDCIITNPPFRLGAAFIERAASWGVPFALLLPATFFHADKRVSLYYSIPPAYEIKPAWRPVFAPDRGQSPTMNVTWWVWGKPGEHLGPTCATVIRKPKL